MRATTFTCVVLAALLWLPSNATAGKPFHRGHGHHHGRHHHHGFGRTSFSFGFGVTPGFYNSFSYFPFSYARPRYSIFYGGYDPYCYSGFGYSSYGFTGPGSIYYRPSDGYLDYQLPAVYAPAELAYGPQAMNQFLGVDRRLGLGPLASGGIQDVGALGDDRQLLDKLVNLVDRGLDNGAIVKPQFSPPLPSSPAAKQRAAHFMQAGDALFHESNPHGALQRYKEAAAAAPDLAEAYFRQGHALVATNRFELAAAAFKRALAMKPDLTRDGFLLDDLYAGLAVAKQSNLETLAGEALDHPENSDLFFVLGVTLYYDGDPDRAEKFFRRAAELTTNRDHLQPFLPDVGQVEKPQPVVRTAGLAT